MGPTIAGEIGVFGYRPSVLMDILAGKRAEVGTEVGAYMRTFSGGCSPSDMETALQGLKEPIVLGSSVLYCTYLFLLSTYSDPFSSLSISCLQPI
ncbi:hypothetical protein Lalb_Chr09g0331741 [Lupinus albus]|uniref:Uncharacterized protein n=1 Tax=Lupinus albus TaxID=3870 RepID=A0A6A4Q1A1_LUPAL|nr:hypothetical protein Lalb_Chr09g0331741 [Lupinus albus]